MNGEPAVSIGTISAAVAALMAALVAFGIDLTDDQQKTILGIIAGVGPLIVGIITRSFVTPAAAVVAKLEDGQNVAGPALRAVSDGTPVSVVPSR